MRRSPRQQATFILAVLFAAGPFGAGLLRALAARDVRLLWMALSAFIGALLVRIVATTRSQKTRATLGLSLAILFVATGLAAATAYLLGARSAWGIWLMAFVLGLFLATSNHLYAGSQPTDPAA